MPHARLPGMSNSLTGEHQCVLAILLRLRSSGEPIVSQYESTPPSRYPDRLIEAICDETTKADRFDYICGIAARRRAFVLDDDLLAARTKGEEFEAGASVSSLSN